MESKSKSTRKKSAMKRDWHSGTGSFLQVKQELLLQSFLNERIIDIKHGKYLVHWVMLDVTLSFTEGFPL